MKVDVVDRLYSEFAAEVEVLLPECTIKLEEGDYGYRIRATWPDGTEISGPSIELHNLDAEGILQIPELAALWVLKQRRRKRTTLNSEWQRSRSTLKSREA